MLILKLLGGLSACWIYKSHLVFVLVQRGLQVKFGCGHTSSGNFQTGWDWLNYEFRTEWQSCFLLVMDYTSFKAHSYVLLSCSQTFLKNSWSGKWHSKPGWMTSFKGPLKSLLHVTNSQQDKIAETFSKSFLFPLFITRNTFFLAIHPLESHRKEKSSSFGCSGTDSFLSRYLLDSKFKKSILDVLKLKCFEWLETTFKTFSKNYKNI